MGPKLRTGQAGRKRVFSGRRQRCVDNTPRGGGASRGIVNVNGVNALETERARRRAPQLLGSNLSIKMRGRSGYQSDTPKSHDGTSGHCGQKSGVRGWGMRIGLGSICGPVRIFTPV